jgi:hypothetical protein
MPYSYFPVSLYNDVLVTDILKKFKLSDKFKKSVAVENYRIKEEDTPESLAYLLYGNTQLSWLILMLNDIKDRNNEWPYSFENLENKINKTYNTSALYFYDSDFTVNISTVNSLSINGHNYGIKSIDPNLNKIVTIEKIPPYIGTGDFVQMTFRDSRILARTNPRRIVYEDSYSIHHFEDADGDYTDPRSTVDDREYQEEYSYIYQYASQQAEEYVITNRDYELLANDAKRDVILLLPEYKNAIVSKISRLFKNTDKSNNVLELESDQLLREISE